MNPVLRDRLVQLDLVATLDQLVYLVRGVLLDQQVTPAGMVSLDHEDHRDKLV